MEEINLTVLAHRDRRISRQLLISLQKYIVTLEDITNRITEVIFLSNVLGGPQIMKDPVRGWGLFADKDYKSGKNITCYGGIRVPRDSEGDYVAATGTGRPFIDGKYGFNIYTERGRWINESDATRSIVNVILGERVVVVKDVKKGEQLFADYGDEYERSY